MQGLAAAVLLALVAGLSTPTSGRAELGASFSAVTVPAPFAAGRHDARVATRAARCTRATRRVGCAARSLAQAVTIVREVEMFKPFPVVVPNPCTGIPVALEGRNHIRLHIRMDASGRIHETIFTVDSHGNGTNLADMGKYSVAERQFQQLNFPIPTWTLTTQISLHVVRAGEAIIKLDDFTMREHVHVTINANGVPTASFLKPTFECR